jgi:thiamine transporter ThiT
MKKNMGTADRIIRIAIVIGIAVAYFTGMLSGTLAIVLGIIAVVFLLTSLVGMCPLYTLLGISSCPRSERT